MKTALHKVRGALACLFLAMICLASAMAVAQDEPAPEAPGAEGEAPEGEAPEGEAQKAPEPVAATDGADVAVSYDMRVKELEEKVNDLKEKIFRSKSRLVLLKETVLRGKIAGSKAVLVHMNDMGSDFKLEQVIYSLDGNQIYNKIDNDGDLADKERIELFNGAIVPGKHNISVLLIYRGNTYGAFNYFKNYEFTVRSSYTFTAEEGKTTEVKIIGFEKGNFTTALEERPDVRYELEFFEDEDQPAPGRGK